MCVTRRDGPASICRQPSACDGSVTTIVATCTATAARQWSSRPPSAATTGTALDGHHPRCGGIGGRGGAGCLAAPAADTSTDYGVRQMWRIAQRHHPLPPCLLPSPPPRQCQLRKKKKKNTIPRLTTQATQPHTPGRPHSPQQKREQGTTNPSHTLPTPPPRHRPPALDHIHAAPRHRTPLRPPA